ncbi:Hemolysin [Fusobacterium vincentii ATCC 49256]|uniref:Hemolysin n=1 Tax=Fusobacterium vincentii ATCC 49256 TaxID=209882 RepID=Q7P6T3_FUSVC|nr:Hemolysin [Fusobacterium vincentii ATCC 49256]
MDSFKQMKSGDILGGIASSTNTVTGIVSGLASNQGTKLPLSAVNKNNSDGDNDDDQNNQDNTVGKDNLKAAQATNNFYANAGVNLGFNKSSSESKSHNEFGVVTTIKGKDKNSSITYNNVKNITYVGTQAQNTKFIYNNVENITKTAVELNNYSSSNSRSSGISAGVTIGYGDGVQTSVDAVKVSASKSNMNTNGTNFQNGKFLNVDEVHNNTKNMTLSGFNQEGGTVTGNIQNLTIESKQNTSTTIGSTKGGSLSIAPNGMPSGSVNYSQTNGERKYVDNATTFLIGNGSNLKIGKVDNTAAAIGATGNGKISIDEYVGHNLENVDKSKTVGGSVGISTSGINSIGINYNDRKQEGITKNTVIGNVEIEKFSGAEINKDLDSMTEVTKDRKFETNVNIESQTIKYALNPESFKKDLAKAKDEITDIGNVVENTINPKGEDSRNIFANLRAQRWVTSYNNVTGSRMEELSRQFKAGEIDEKQLKEAARDLIKGYGKDIGIDFEVVYLDEETMPKDSKGSTGSSYILDKKNKKVLIPIDVNKIGDINKLFGTLTEEVSHGKDALEGRQDKKVAKDKSNDEEGLESLGRPANDYVKNKLGEDNNSKIKLSTDGIDLTNADVGEKVGDSDFVLETVATTGTGMVTGISAPVVAGIAVAGGIVYYNIFMPEEEKEQLKREISQIYENTKEGFSSILDKEDFKDLVIAVIKSELKERGIEADVKIDKDGNVIYTLSPLPEDMKKPKIPPFPLPDKKIFQIPPMIPPKQETQKKRWEREERDRREQKEKMDERNKPNGVPLQQEKPVTIYTISTNEAKEMYKGVQGKNKVTNIKKFNSKRDGK